MDPIKISITTLLAAVSIALPTTVAAAPARDASGDGKKIAQLQQDFLKLNFGMFLHYNMATYTGEEWVVGYCAPSPPSMSAASACGTANTPPST